MELRCVEFFAIQKKPSTLNHSLLIKKLQYYGIKGKSKSLLESYITNTYQRVQIENSSLNTKIVSGWTKVKHGVPQGSILGPLLFLLYINGFPNSITYKATPILFADDISIIISRPILIYFKMILPKFLDKLLNCSKKIHFLLIYVKHISCNSVVITKIA